MSPSDRMIKLPLTSSLSAVSPQATCLVVAMPEFSRSVLILNAQLGLPPLVRRVCHGYANVCQCEDCRRRAKNGLKARRPAAQPWEARKAA